MPSGCLPFFARKKPTDISRINPLHHLDVFDVFMLNCKDRRRYKTYSAAFIAALENHENYLSLIDIPADRTELKAAELHYIGELTRVLKTGVDTDTLQQILNRIFIGLDRYCGQKKLHSQLRDCIELLAQTPALLAGFGLTHLFPKDPGDDEYSLLLSYYVNRAYFQATVERKDKTHFIPEKFNSALLYTLAQYQQHLQQQLSQSKGTLMVLEKQVGTFFTPPTVEAAIAAERKIMNALRKEKTMTEEFSKKLGDHFKTSTNAVELNVFLSEVFACPFELSKLARVLSECEGFAQIYHYDKANTWLVSMPDWDFVRSTFCKRGDSTDSDLSVTLSTSSRSSCSV